MNAEEFNALDFTKQASIMAFRSDFVCDKQIGNYLLYRIYQVGGFYVRVTINTEIDSIVGYKAFEKKDTLKLYIGEED